MEINPDDLAHLYAQRDALIVMTEQYRRTIEQCMEEAITWCNAYVELMEACGYTTEVMVEHGYTHADIIKKIKERTQNGR